MNWEAFRSTLVIFVCIGLDVYKIESLWNIKKANRLEQRVGRKYYFDTTVPTPNHLRWQRGGGEWLVLLGPYLALYLWRALNV